MYVYIYIYIYVYTYIALFRESSSRWRMAGGCAYTHKQRVSAIADSVPDVKPDEARVGLINGHTQKDPRWPPEARVQKRANHKSIQDVEKSRCREATRRRQRQQRLTRGRWALAVILLAPCRIRASPRGISRPLSVSGAAQDASSHPSELCGHLPDEAVPPWDFRLPSSSTERLEQDNYFDSLSSLTFSQCRRTNLTDPRLNRPCPWCGILLLHQESFFLTVLWTVCGIVWTVSGNLFVLIRCVLPSSLGHHLHKRIHSSSQLMTLSCYADWHTCASGEYHLFQRRLFKLETIIMRAQQTISTQVVQLQNTRGGHWDKQTH